MGRIEIEIDERMLKQLVREYVERLAGEIPITENDIQIETKSKQNYKSEWETAAFRARVSKLI